MYRNGAWSSRIELRRKTRRGCQETPQDRLLATGRISSSPIPCSSFASRCTRRCGSCDGRRALIELFATSIVSRIDASVPPASERVEEFRGAFLSFQCARFISSKSLSPGVEQEPTEKTEKRSFVLRFLRLLLFSFSASEEICPALPLRIAAYRRSSIHWRVRHFLPVELVALRRVAPRRAAQRPSGGGPFRPLYADGLVAARQAPPARNRDAPDLPDLTVAARLRQAASGAH